MMSVLLGRSDSTMQRESRSTASESPRRLGLEVNLDMAPLSTLPVAMPGHFPSSGKEITFDLSEEDSELSDTEADVEIGDHKPRSGAGSSMSDRSWRTSLVEHQPHRRSVSQSLDAPFEMVFDLPIVLDPSSRYMYGSSAQANVIDGKGSLEPDLQSTAVLILPPTASTASFPLDEFPVPPGFDDHPQHQQRDASNPRKRGSTSLVSCTPSRRYSDPGPRTWVWLEGRKELKRVMSGIERRRYQGEGSVQCNSSSSRSRGNGVTPRAERGITDHHPHTLTHNPNPITDPHTHSSSHHTHTQTHWFLTRAVSPSSCPTSPCVDDDSSSPLIYPEEEATLGLEWRQSSQRVRQGFQLDSSPTLPAFDISPTTTQTHHDTDNEHIPNLRLPPSPIRTPSSCRSRRSLEDFPILATPQHSKRDRDILVVDNNTNGESSSNSSRNSLSSCYSQRSSSPQPRLSHKLEHEYVSDKRLASVIDTNIHNIRSGSNISEIAQFTPRSPALPSRQHSVIEDAEENSTDSFIHQTPFQSDTTATTGAHTHTRTETDTTSMAYVEYRNTGRSWYSQDLPGPPQLLHQKSPSVPSSTRSTSTFSDKLPTPLSPPTDSSRILSPPSSFIHLNADLHLRSSSNQASSTSQSRRFSKLAALSGSSSSLASNSSDSSSLRNERGGHYLNAEARDISTVYEEEASFDQKQELHLNQRKQTNHIFSSPKGRSGPGLATSPTFGFGGQFPAPPPPPSAYHNNHISHSISPFNQSSNRNSRIPTGVTPSAKSFESFHPFASSVAAPPHRSKSASLRGKASKAGAARGEPTFAPPPVRPPFVTYRCQPNLTDLFKPDPEYLTADMAVPRGIVSTEIEAEDLCPICVLDLSYEYKMAGEKANVMPQCGHAMHWECYQTAYADRSGICGVCREPIVLRDGGSGGKLASITGQPSRNLTLLHEPLSATSTRSAPGRLAGSAGQADEDCDDAIEASSATSRSSRHGQPSKKLVIPSIKVNAEYPHLDAGRSRDGKAITSVMITICVPPAGEKSYYASRTRAEVTNGEARLPPLPPSPRSDMTSDPFAGPLSARSPVSSQPSPASFGPILADLARRVPGYDKMDLNSLGPLVLFDILTLTKAFQTREFYLYLFDQALVCVAEEEKKGGLRGMFTSNSSSKSGGSGSSRRMALMVKGKVYSKDLCQIVDSSVPGEISLSVTMHEPSGNLETFTIAFKDKSTQENWRTTLTRLRDQQWSGMKIHSAPLPGTSNGNSSSKIARLMGQEAGHLVIPYSANSVAPRPGYGDLASPGETSPYSVSLPSASSSRSLSELQCTPGDLVYQRPIAPVHTPLDLVIVVCIPHVADPDATPSLKLRLVRQALATVLAVMGSKDRVSLVASEVGSSGKVRKTPYLNPTRFESRKRLEAFVATLGQGQTEEPDEFEVRKNREERQGVVTAMNAALDVVLQRKNKNPLSGVIVISEIAETFGRGHMDLVKARLDAASLPVHCIGYTKSHDPSALWVMTEHTKGTYTFVKDWMDLRQSLVGCVAGMMSIALTKLKLHLNCRDHDFRIKKVEGTQENFAISNGKDVNIELFELRFGETRELIVQMEYENPLCPPSPLYDNEGRLISSSARGQYGNSMRTSSIMTGRTGTSALALGLDNLSLSMDDRGPSLPDLVREGTVIDEIPALEVDSSFSDPAIGRSVAHLSHPVLLTMAILPQSLGQLSSAQGQPLSPVAGPGESKSNGTGNGIGHPAPSSASVISSSSGGGGFVRPKMNGDPTVIRRRMELFASEMLTRALMIASRRSFSTAISIAKQTKLVLEGVMDSWRASLPPGSSPGVEISQVQVQNGHGQVERRGKPRSAREVQILNGLERLAGPMSDVECLLEGLEEQREMFEKDHKRVAVQQAIVLRLQRAWTTKTTTEMAYCSLDVQDVIEASNHFRPLV